MIERTSVKLYPIVNEVLKKTIHESSDVDRISFDKHTLADDADMRSVLGFLNQNQWINDLNIGNIMQLQAVTMTDLLSCSRNELELSRDSFLQKISLTVVAYFCVSTEMRFLMQSRQIGSSPSPLKPQREQESEYWHAKSLEIACTFLPSECPLLNHILLSYQKHHAPSNQVIKEDEEQADVLNVVRPLNGIESSKYCPIIR